MSHDDHAHEYDEAHDHVVDRNGAAQDMFPDHEDVAMTASDERGWVVRIVDHSGANESDGGTVEEIKDFTDVAHANAFARAYVRDSIERCRIGGAAGRDVIEAWFSFGEDAEILDAGEEGWKSANELDDFAANIATPMERDWRALDPRRLVEDDEDELSGQDS